MAFCDLLSKYVDSDEWQGTAIIQFAEGNFSGCSANDKPTSFCELGSTGGFSLEQDNNTEYRERWACGRMHKGAPTTSDNGFRVTAPLRQLSRENISKLLRGKDGTAIAQPALTAQAIDAFAFDTTAADLDKTYDLTDSSTGTKVNIYNITGVTISNGGTPLVEGTDFVVRKKLGQVKFLTLQNASLTVEVTAEASTITPLVLGGGQVREGWIRVLYVPTLDSVGDQCEPEVIIEGGGYLKFDDSLEVASDSVTELSLGFDFQQEADFVDLRVRV